MSATLVIVPAWNEAAVLPTTIREIREAMPEADLLVVDDGSTDDTAVAAERAGARVLVLPYNLGVGGAMRAGFKYALRHDYDRAIQVDADGQHDAGDIHAVLAGLGSANISIGARFAGKGSYRVRGPRRWAMRLLAATLSRASGVTLTDVTSGFRAADRLAMRQFVSHYPAEYLGDTVDALMAAVRAGLTVTQVPVSMRPRRGGAPSTNPAASTAYLVRSLFALLIASTRRRSREAAT